MWLRSGQQINQVDVNDILILSSSVKVVESARDLGVIIDSQLSLSSLVAALCRSGFYYLRQLRPLCRSLPAEAAKTLVSGVHFMSPGLLQLFAVRSDRQTYAASIVGAECCGKAGHRSQTSRTHHTDIASTSLAAGQTTSWVQDGQLGIPSAVKQNTWLSGRRYSSRLRKFCSLPQVLFGEKVLCHSCSQSFW